MIKARVKAENPDANLKSYTRTYKAFSWADAEKEFTWHKTGQMNIAYEAIDRWAADPEKRDQQALIFERGEEVRAYRYCELKELSCQWAHVFIKYGLKRGDRVFIFLPPSPEIYFAMLACSRVGVIFCPLYSTLAYDELEVRIRDAKPRGIVTHPDLAERLPIDAMSPVEHVFFTQGPLPGLFPGEVLVADLLNQAPKEVQPTWLTKDTPLYLIYTSGSTGPPKGVVHAHRDMVGHLVTAQSVLDVRGDTILWTDGDPAWVTGTVYGAFAPWLCGATSAVQGDPFSASTCYRTLERHKVSVWYTTPVTIKKLMEAGQDLPTRYNLSRLRHIATVGEPLIPDLFYWVKKNLKHPPHDTWWMTECGMVCLANFPSMDVKPGSMGKPVPGVEAAIIDEKGDPLPLLTMGELALKVPWPSMMIDIWRDKARYEAYFTLKPWFLTGDMAIMDEEGYYYHQGRTDDLIKAGEKLVGPYEIEHILYQHPAVLEAAVISKSEPPSTPHLKAFITIGKTVTPSNRLKQEIKAFVKANLSPDTPLKEIDFLDELPKTSAGNILRRVLRARELGLPSGDPSHMKE
jgi:acetyl-CoA synthetase